MLGSWCNRRTSIAFVAALAACGRIGFDPRGDAGDDAGDGSVSDGVVDLPCNTPVAVGGVLPSLEVDVSNTRWLTATGSPNGLFVAYTTSVGVLGVSIDLRTEPISRSATTLIAPTSQGNLNLTVSEDRVLFTTRGVPPPGLDLTVMDLTLAPISSRNELRVDASAPANTAPRSGGGFVVVGSDASMAQAISLDRHGARITAQVWPLTGASGGSVAPLPGGGFAAIWYGNDCELKLLSNDLVQVGRVAAMPCGFSRIAVSATPRIGLGSFIGGTFGVDSFTFDPSLGTPSPRVDLYPTAFSPPRLVASDAGFWIVFPEMGRPLHAELFGDLGDDLTAVPVDLGPFTATANLFQYDVAAHAGRAYAVWLSDAQLPVLYVAQLCRP